MISEKREETSKIIKENRVAIKEARDDQRNCDKKYSARRVAELKAEYEPIFANATPDKLPEIKKEYNKKLHIAKRERLVTQIQMIFQDPIASLNPRMTVETIVSEGLIIKGVRDKAYIQEKVYEALEQVGLVREHATRYPHEFSGGQRQRIGIARSIIMRPDLIIADEPISALDVSIQAQVINLLNDLRSQLGLTIMFIAHDLSVVKYFSDRIGVMYYGNLVELTSSDELFKHPFHPYTRSLLSAIPSPDPIYEKKRKRITYNPLVDHDYSKEQPTLREVLPGHFVLCNTAEMEEYRRIAAEKDLIQKAE
ncbi:MAG: ATP-binding cassette domain-containing protein [Clostridia bacterium]|nr:ATP-binding cassette domain-containing protein [Clostridia bacterium]